MNNLYEHNLSMRILGPKISFNNNIKDRGCMALALAIGPSLAIGEDPLAIEKKFLDLICNDEAFCKSMVDSRGKCINVLRKSLIISKMKSNKVVTYNNTKYDYNDVVNMCRILHIDNATRKAPHFVMLIPFFKRERYSIYDPAFPFLMDDATGLFRYYKTNSNRGFVDMRWYPFNP